MLENGEGFTKKTHNSAATLPRTRKLVSNSFKDIALLLTCKTCKGSLTVWALDAYFSDSQNAAFELLVWCM